MKIEIYGENEEEDREDRRYFVHGSKLKRFLFGIRVADDYYKYLKNECNTDSNFHFYDKKECKNSILNYLIQRKLTTENMTK
jgi:hypothetical protein